MNNQILEEDFRFILSHKLPWEKFNNKTLLISGANGFIPSYLIKFLLYANDKRKTQLKIIGIARNKKRAEKRFREYSRRNDFKLIFQDISDPIKIKREINFLVHAASQASPKYYNVDPVGTLKANTLGTYNLLELSRKNPVESFLFISAGEVYGINNQIAKTNETSYGYLNPMDVRSCYAESKRISETMCVAYHHQYQVPAKIVRLYHTYGPDILLDDGRVFADFVSNIINNENIIMKSEGKTVRSFCYIADAISGFLTVLLKGRNAQAYNLANEKATISIRTLAETLVNLYPQKKLRVVIRKRDKEDQYLESKIMVNKPDTAKLTALNWKPHFGIKDGFRRTIESFSRI